MALLAWYTFDNTYENIGVANTTLVANGGANTFTDGKIGKSLVCNGSTWWNINGLTFTQNLSICCWARTTVSGKMIWVIPSSASDRLNLYCSGIYTLNTGDGNNNPYQNNGVNVNVYTDGLWHHFVTTFNGSVAKLYIDGIYRGTAKTYRNPTPTSNRVQIAGGYGGGHTYDWNGAINDFRVYNECLTDEQIKKIYQSLICHYTFADSFDLDKLQYDHTVYTEPDGSQWVRVSHHNNPKATKFSSSHTNAEWIAGVYESEDRWYELEHIVKYFTRFEFMVKQKVNASDSTETKYRWIQKKRPDLAVWSEVKPGQVTNNTSSGYTNGGQGGLYPYNHTSTRMRIANESESNWFGAFGAWTAHSIGIPGYPNTAIGDGYLDLYICISNFQYDQVYDVSGYRHNGIINNLSQLILIRPSPRYYNAVQFGAVNTPNITVDINSVLPYLTNCTVTWWEYPNNTSNKLLFQGQSSYEYIGAANASSTPMYSLTIGSSGANVYCDGILYPNTYGTASSRDKLTNAGLYHKTDGWHHFVFSGINLSSWTQFKFNTYGSWAMNMNLTDFRIYATALNATDVKELYETSMVIIDNEIQPRILNS